MLVAVLMAAVLVGCGIDLGYDDGFDEQVCMDRAAKENALYLKAMEGAIPAERRVEVNEWSGCDSAPSGAELHVFLDPDADQKTIRGWFESGGWSSGLAREIAAQCGTTCAYDNDFVKKVGRRVIGVTLDDNWVGVHAADQCWDDNGYRCE
ncbi:hypothetical protein [Sphaerisporangium sp. NPDC051011]|uniref:hypothetical protein n=1 Tax=Sphaerisporangium sp. NPDC051011 TaxID=3155792 RepID=UPI00340FE0A2